MKVKVYQVIPDAIDAIFRGYYAVTHKGHGVRPENYQCVFEGEVEGAKGMEDIFMTFNLCTSEYPNYKGHSLTVSDIVEQVDGNPKYVRCHFCDTVGFVKLTNFDTSKIPVAT